MNERLAAFHPLWKGAEKPGAPVVLLLHGTGGDERQLFPLTRQICGQNDISFLGVRGQVREGSSNRFFRRFGEGVFDEEDIVRRANDLAEALELASTEYGFKLTRLYALGFSNGANIAAALMLLRPEVLADAVMLRPMLPLTPEALPQLAGKGALLLSGERDPWGPPDSARALANLLSSGGAEVLHRVLPAGHGLIDEDLECAGEWFSARWK